VRNLLSDLSKTRLLAGLAAVLAAALACGGSSGGGGGGSKASYTVTINNDKSGVFASSGVPDTNGFQAYMAHLNAAGGVNGHKINVMDLDDRSDVPTALSNYQQTLSSNSLAFLENTNSAVIAAIGAKATADGIVEASPGGYKSGVGLFPYIYTLNPAGTAYYNIVSSFAASEIPNHTGASAAFIAYDSALTETFQPAMGRAMEAKGFKMTYSQLVPATAVDFAVAAGNIASAAPAIIVTSLQDTQIVQFVNQVRARNVSVPIINFSSNVSPASMKKLNDPKMFVVEYVADPTNTSSQPVNDMLKVAKQTGFTQDDDSFFWVEAYVFARVVAAAIGRCGDTCTRQSFNDALEKTSVDGAGLMAGNPGFSKDDHVMTKKAAVFQWDDSHGYLNSVKGFGLS
jgi:branched-chain amino acid transport system substrate-binding protein